jgi:cytochrome c-type biogenesis protein CcmH
MLFWTFAALMTAAATLCVLWPLSRDRSEADKPDRIDVLRGQMDALMARLAAAEGEEEVLLEQERAELGRRILQLADETRAPKKRKTAPATYAASLFGLIAVPAIALPLYIQNGSPDRSDQPLSASASVPLEDRSVAEMVRIAERHLRDSPDDLRGWQVLADVYAGDGRLNDRIRALNNIVRIQPRNADARTELGEAITQTADNIVTDRALVQFETALAIDPTHRKAGFYRAIALEQDGQRDAAIANWQQLAAMEPQDAEWKAVVARQMSRLTGTAPRIDNEAAAQISNLDEDARAEMIRGMVARLQSRLEDEPGDLIGWQRLLRAHDVLGTPEAALAVLDRAISKTEPGSTLFARLAALRAQQETSRP